MYEKQKWPKDSTNTIVVSSTASQTLVAASDRIAGGKIYNNSNQTLYILEGLGANATTTADSVSNWTFPLLAGGLYIIDDNCVGGITGAWAAANGDAHVMLRTA